MNTVTGVISALGRPTGLVSASARSWSCWRCSLVSQSRYQLHRQDDSQIRSWSTTTARPSGHNRWSKIKHDKAKEDLSKSRARTYLAQNVIAASRDGGPDPKMNPKLAYAIAAAKRGQLSKESIEKSIAKGQGKSLSGASLETVVIEAMLPHGVATIIECQTENKARVLQDIRYILNRANASQTPTAFLFDKKGIVRFEEQNKVGIDEVMDEAIEAGAEDILLDEAEDEEHEQQEQKALGGGKRLIVETPPEAVTAVAQRLSDSFGLKVQSSEILYVAKEDMAVTLSEEQSAEVQNVISSIEGDEDLQALYTNIVV